MQDEYAERAKDDTNRAWAYREGEDVLERDQAKWEYAVENRAAHLRYHALALRLSHALEEFIRGHKEGMDRLFATVEEARQALKDD